MAGIGPGPFCGMILADLGAEIIRVDRASAAGTGSREEPSNRGKKSIAVDLKSDEGVEVVLKLVESADAIFEGFRPGVMERLGLGPEVCEERNEKIIPLIDQFVINVNKFEKIITTSIPEGLIDLNE